MNPQDETNHDENVEVNEPVVEDSKLEPPSVIPSKDDETKSEDTQTALLSDASPEQSDLSNQTEPPAESALSEPPQPEQKGELESEPPEELGQVEEVEDAELRSEPSEELRQAEEPGQAQEVEDTEPVQKQEVDDSTNQMDEQPKSADDDSVAPTDSEQKAPETTKEKSGEVVQSLPEENKAEVPNEVSSQQKEGQDAEEPEDSKKHKIKSRKMSYPFNKMVANFAGCGRCSYFLAGYRVLQGELVLEKAANRMSSNQLQLPWEDEMRKLLVNSYGIHFDVDFLRFNGTCPECGRPFTYKESLSPKKTASTFTIQFNFKK